MTSLISVQHLENAGDTSCIDVSVNSTQLIYNQFAKTAVLCRSAISFNVKDMKIANYSASVP